MTEPTNQQLRRRYRKPSVRSFGSLAAVTRFTGVDPKAKNDMSMTGPDKTA